MAGNVPRKSAPGRPQRTTASRLAAGLDRLAGRPLGRQLEGVVRRFLKGPSAIPPAPQATADQDAALQRARTALANARTQMPGLLSGNGPALGAAPGALRSSAAEFGALLAPAPELALSIGTGGLARLEEAILRLEDERRRLSAEVEALRLAVGELRETLLQLDDRESYPRGTRLIEEEETPVDEGAPARPLRELEQARILPSLPREGDEEAQAAAEPDSAVARADRAEDAESEGAESEDVETAVAGEEPEAAAEPEPALSEADSNIYPSGSVGVCLRVASVAGPVALDAIHRALMALTEVDSVRLLSYADGLAEFRIYLRQPATHARLVTAITTAAPPAFTIPDARCT